MDFIEHNIMCHFRNNFYQARLFTIVIVMSWFKFVVVCALLLCLMEPCFVEAQQKDKPGECKGLRGIPCIRCVGISCFDGLFSIRICLRYFVAGFLIPFAPSAPLKMQIVVAEVTANYYQLKLPACTKLIRQGRLFWLQCFLPYHLRL